MRIIKYFIRTFQSIAKYLGGLLVTVIRDPSSILKVLKHVVLTLLFFSMFFLQLSLFLIEKILVWLIYRTPFGLIVKPILPWWDKHLKLKAIKILDRIDKVRIFKMRRSYLIRLGYDNLRTKKTRSLVTVLGMSIGVGIIVYLLSLGYGVERLVIGRVAGLDELRMADVSVGTSTTLRMNTDMIQKVQKIPQVSKAIPIISTVGRINFQKATTDVMVFSAPQDYFDATRMNFLRGKPFKDNTVAHLPAIQDTDSSDNVAGAYDERKAGTFDKPITGASLFFNMLPTHVATAFADCNIQSEIKGYLLRYPSSYTGREYWGSEYAPLSPHGRAGYDAVSGQYLGKWIKVYAPLHKQSYDDVYEPVLDESGRQAYADVCIQRKNIHIEEQYAFTQVAQVLGMASDSADLQEDSSASAELDDTVRLVSTREDGIEFVELAASMSAQVKKQAGSILFQGAPSGNAIVSTGLIDLLNIPLARALDSQFDVSFIVVKNLLPKIEGRAFSEEAQYRIVGVVDDNDSQYFYVPFRDIQSLGIENYSQLRVVVKNKADLPVVRKQIETWGYTTTSTSDTVREIETLFTTIRIALVALGMIALGVASLGMFNTLTVSLLERTREIGGMKVMGMVSDEVQELFMAEAMIMGMGGGIGGLLLGFAAGKATSLALSTVAISQGAGYIDVTFVPVFLAVFILLLSFGVGAVTGLYPARRSKQISAINALRYE